MATKDKMASNVSEEQNEALSTRYVAFKDSLGNAAKPVVRVYDPMCPEQMERMELIREISRELQEKKQNEMIKVKAANVK